MITKMVSIFMETLPYVGTLLLLTAYFGLGTEAGRRVARAFYRVLGHGMPLLLFFPYLFASRLHVSLNEIIRFGVALYLPWLFFSQVKAYRRFSIWLGLTLLAIWFPLEPDLFLLPFGKAAAPWARWLSMPSASAPLFPGVTLPLEKLSMVLMALFLFTVRMPLAHLGFTWKLTRADFRRALSDVIVFATIGIPIGVLIGFLHFKMASLSATEIILAALGIYFFVAIPEEILFRGLIQNLLQRYWHKRRGWGLWVAAFIFGLSHINNATPGFPVPNYAYVLLATIAGWVYGSTWWSQRKVTASALTHTGVNLLWLLFFVR